MASAYQTKEGALGIGLTCPADVAVGDPVRIASNLTVAKVSSTGHRDIIGSVVQHDDDNTYCTVATPYNYRRTREATAELSVGPFAWGTGNKPVAWTPGGFAAVTGTVDGPFVFAKATFTGTVDATFEITLDTNDVFKIKVGAADPVTIQLTAGAARTAAQVATEIAAITGVTAAASGDKVMVTADAVGTKIELQAVTHSCYTTLGFTAGTFESNDTISVTIGDGTAQTYSFAAGSTTIASVVNAVNSNIDGVTATASGNKLVLTCDDLGVDFSLDATDNDAYTLLGFTAGDVENTDPSHSELAIGGVVISGPSALSLSGVVKGPYAITNSSNDAFKLAIGSGSDQTFDLTAGTARTATQVAADLNATGTGFVASVSDDRVVLTASSPWNDIIIKTVANDSYTALGFTAGTYAASKTVQTLEY